MSAQEPDPRPIFLDRLFAKKQRPPGPPPNVSHVEGTRYATRALEEEVHELLSTPEGGRNDRLNVAAFNLGQLVGAGLLEYATVWDALHTAALHIGLGEGETVATLRSGLHTGMDEPRQVPELVRADDTPAVTTWTAPEGLAEEAVQGIGERFEVLDWVKLWADDTVDEWLVEPLLPARRLVALFSPPKVGKSLFMLELAVAVSRGAPFLGNTGMKPRVVLYVDFENDPRGDVRTRLQAMNLAPHHLENLKYLSYPAMAKLDTWVGGQELLAIAQFYGAEVVVIDTISRAVGGEENDNDTWLSFYRNTGLQLKAAGIACIRLDHTGKDESKGMRGGSAKYGDVDLVWSMQKVDESTLKLECTANRLPVASKFLVVDRELAPLRHVLNTEGMAASLAAALPPLVGALDRAGFPTVGDGAGVRKAYEWLKANGVPCTQRAAHLAQKQRQERTAEDHPFDHPTPYKD